MKKIIIAGPCSAETESQILETAIKLKQIGVKIIRASLFKPRTNPGFEGVGLKGCLWLAKITKMNLIAATEILLPQQVKKVIEKIKKEGGKINNLLFWIGARNQNHLIQKQIAKNILKYAPSSVKLLIKNQPWPDEKHWLGIVNHILSVGFPKNRLILCHRGFADNPPPSFRNRPDYQMAKNLKKTTQIPLVIDPSHIGGTKDNVIKVIKETIPLDFNGYIIEVHPTPEKAKTDAKQQLSIEEFRKIFMIINHEEK